MEEIRPICTRCNQRPCKPSKKHKSGYIKFCSSCEQKHYGYWETRKHNPNHKQRRYKSLDDRVKARYLTFLGHSAGALIPCHLCGFMPVHSCQMDIDHIDGNHKNNEFANLQIICSNCHRLKTYRERLK